MRFASKMGWVLSVLLVGRFAHGKSTYDQVVALIQKNPATGQPTQNLEELIPLLPVELKSNFTLIYKSRSPFGGLGDDTKSAVDPLHPRVVLFSKDGRLTLAFTGNPDKPGYNVVETIHFVDEGARFELAQFILPAAEKSDASLHREAQQNGVPNPTSCLRCHGKDPRPISDSYPLWPGFYGSVRDTFPKGSPEITDYRSFLSKNAKTGVYRLLNWAKGTSVPPYLDPARYNPNQIEASVGELKFLPNTRLGMAWTELNRKRIQRKLKASPLYQTYRYAILSGFLGCETLPITQTEVDSTYQDLVDENTDRIQRLGSTPQGPGSSPLDMMEIGFYANEVQIRYLAHSLGIDLSDWSMAFEKDSLSFFDGILSSIYDNKDFYLKEDVMLEMLRDLANDEPQFRRYFQTYKAYQDQPFSERLQFAAALQACSALRKRVKDTGVKLPTFSNPPATTQPLKEVHQILTDLHLSEEPFRRCTQCHEGLPAILTGRKIPFRSPALLREALKSKTSSGQPLMDEISERISTIGPGQMPPHGEPLREDEVKNLKAYLIAVKGG